MRKALVFLLLLGAGLLLLYWLDRVQRGPPPEGAGETTPQEPALSEESQGFRPGGLTQYTRYDDETKRPLYKIDSRDTRTEGRDDVLKGVTLELYDANGSVELRLDARGARVTRRESSDQLRPEWEERIALEGVEAQVLTGFSLAPLVFQTEQATLDLTDSTRRRAFADSPFRARSSELEITGQGFDWDLDSQRLILVHSGRIELRRAGSPPIWLRSEGDGPLEVRRAEVTGADGADTPLLALEAWKGARLELESEGALVGQHLLLFARPVGTTRDSLTPDRLEADGAVDWTNGEARFQGNSLQASFDASGVLERAHLEGEPRLVLALELGPAGVAAAAQPEERQVVVAGPDAIDLWRQDEGYALTVAGAPTGPDAPDSAAPSISARDFHLESASLSGWLAADRSSARFSAGPGVVVTGNDATLETARFQVDIGPDAAGRTLLIGTASGGARLAGQVPRSGPDGPAPFTLTSPEGLKIERSELGWRVIEGSKVEVTLGEERRLVARADHVQDFLVPRTGSGQLAPEGMRMSAQGEISVDLGDTHFGGEELEVLSVEPVPHVIVRGKGESKAYVRGPPGQASALEVELTGDTWTARGEVTGSAELERDAQGTLTTFTFAGDELELDQSESPELLPGERLRTLRAQVTGNAEVSFTARDQTLVAHSQRFSVENRARLLEGEETPHEIGSLFISEGGVHADFLAHEGELAVDCERFEIERTARDLETGFRQLTASGDVRFQGKLGAKAGLDLGGECEIFVLGADRKGSLQDRTGGRVALRGRMPGRDIPFRMTADRVDFELESEELPRILALRPELRMLGLRARAEHFTVDDKRGVLLSGSARLSGSTPRNVPFTLDAEEIVLVGRRDAPAGADVQDQLDSMSARGHVDFRLADGLRARGDRLAVRRSTGLLRLDGAPASFEMGTTHLEAEWVEFDPVLQVLVATGRGRMLSEADARTLGEDSWLLEFFSVSTLLDLDSVVLVIQEPVFRTAQFDSALRASWAILWLNREAFQDTSRRNELIEGLQRALGSMKTLRKGAGFPEVLGLFQSKELAGFVREVYFEGPVEVLAEGEIMARADAIYLDAASQHGWLARATVNLGGQFLGQRQEKLIIKADWLRISSDGSLRADQATVTSCDFDEPHVRVVTGDLRIEPGSGLGKERYRLLLKDNRIEVYDLVEIPLPTIDVSTDEEFKPLWPTLSLADSARFGTLFSFALTRPADNVGKVFDSIARGEDEGGPDDAAEPATPEKAPAPRKPRSKVDAHYKIDGSYLGSRGALLDLGLEIKAKNAYWFDLYLGLVLDSGDDRGFIRVRDDDRDTLRRWLRSQAYFDHGKSAWSFSFSDQSDPAVQSEFFEGQFLRYERAENYVQWRRSSEEYFVQGTAKLRVDDFRTEVEELPSVGAYRGRSPLLAFGPLALLHTGDLTAEYLRRRAGNGPRSPFSPSPTFGDSPASDFGALDGLGDRTVLRVDSRQTLEVPVALGSGFKLTPFASARATAWSEGVDEEDAPTRFLAEAGARLGATFWKRTSSGKLHQIAPFVELRTELERRDDDGTPFRVDGVERLLSGDFLRFGSRNRFASDGTDSLFDLDLVGTWARDRSDGEPDGWLPFEVFARFLVEPYGQEFEIFHDGRYDLENDRTAYSLVSLGTHFGEEWGVQFSHQRGLDTAGQPLFEAASVSGLYRWTEKWEFEARESFSLLENQGLDTRFVVRRYGHDVVFDLESSVREGEGSSFGISIEPRFGFHPPRVGYVPW